MIELSAADARRIALAAQGFAKRRPDGARPAGLAAVRRVATQLQALQIDSVNVLARAHYLPAFSRLGAYDTAALDALAYRRRELFEYWGHAASLLPVELHPLLRWRMEAFAADPRRSWGRVADNAYLHAVLAEVAARGPIAASELAEPGERAGPWWGWGEGKSALEWLFATGRVAVAGRRGFERLYDVPERVLPREVLDRPAVPRHDATRELLLRAATALGVGTLRDLADYFRLKVVDGTRRAARELVEEGALLAARVEGWRQQALLHAGPASGRPRRVRARALVSPFDSLVWERDRTARLFGFDYRIEIYVPAPKRTHGYYVLPFLLGEDLVARVDLKADRQASTLRVQSAFVERDADESIVAVELADELREMGRWLGLEHVAVAGRGDLAPALRAAVTRS